MLPTSLQGSVEHAIKKFNDKEVQWSSQGMLRLSHEAMWKLFGVTVESLCQAVGDVMNNPDTRGKTLRFYIITIIYYLLSCRKL